MKTPVRIIRRNPSVPSPSYQTPGAVGFDIPASQVCRIAPHTTELIHTGLTIEVPQHLALLLIARSSLVKKGLLLANSVGVIDQDFSGPEDEIRLALHNLKDTPYNVAEGERLVQGIFVPIDRVEFIETQTLSAVSRGGFGSTGDG